MIDQGITSQGMRMIKRWVKRRKQLKIKAVDKALKSEEGE